MKNFFVLFLIFFMFQSFSFSQEWKIKNKWKISCGLVNKDALIINGKPKKTYSKNEFKVDSAIFKLNKGPKDKVVKQSHIKSEKEYLELFKSVKDEIAVGDASPSYINYPENFGMIKQYLNDPKVIVIVRDPIDRAYSNYLHLKRELRETMDFFSALKNEDNRREESYSDFWYYRFNSTYYKKILMAKKTFSNVLVLTAEEFKRNPEINLKKVYSFLGVKLIVKKQALETKFNVGG